MIQRTDAVLLRVFPYSESSQILVWLSRDHGKITTLAKGAQRPKSRMLGHFDLYYTCEVLYYEKEARQLHILKECSPLKDRRSFRGEWRACAAASYLSHLMYRINPAQAHQSGLFESLDWSLDYLHQNEASPPFLFWFELKLLRLLGLAPQIRRCASCHKNIADAPGPVTFDIEHGGIRCSECKTEHAKHVLQIQPASVAILSNWQRSRHPRIAINTRLDAKQAHDVETLLGRFIEYHLEISQTNRDCALEIMRHNISAG
jgi:DNA repair protein RecO (recombination protein O)